ncbi:MAG TPA: hypothetical protein VMF62_13425 [Acetobacteraceae bacterium]|nr:hypothetical protein [Acetobacteraceae bacterium]
MTPLNSTDAAIERLGTAISALTGNTSASVGLGALAGVAREIVARQPEGRRLATRMAALILAAADPTVRRALEKPHDEVEITVAIKPVKEAPESGATE